MTRLPVPEDSVELLLAAGLRAVYQPVVTLSDHRVVAYEALCRGPVGSALERPDALFAEAASGGLTARLDGAARRVALQGALDAGLRGPATLFLNAEPEGLRSRTTDDLEQLRARAAASGLQIVLEVTERALTSRPAELLAAVERVRDWGWGLAVDDVGAERASLALLPFLAPDVIKLDLRLVQQRTTVEVAEIVNAVRAEAERTGALLLAEGIESPEHETLAVSMGAEYGQGWLYGRPGPLPVTTPDGPALQLASARPPGGREQLTEVFGRPLRATKPLLVAMSKTLERQALTGGEAAVVLGTFQQARYFTPASAARYAALASSAAFVAALATDLPDEPAPGVRGTHLDVEDPLTQEWDLAVVGPHFAAALVARDLGDRGPEHERRFDYLLTYDRATALVVAGSLLRRVGDRPQPAVVRPPLVVAPRQAVALPTPDELSGLLHRAVAASGTGITIVDARIPDQPLVFVNAAFETLSGRAASDVLGRNCRFLQTDGTDPDVLRMLREQLRAGRHVTTTLLNRRPDGSTWWNELSISPVRSPRGELTHFIGVQVDVTARLQAERALGHLARHDALTGLSNRVGFYSALEEALVRGRRHGRLTGLLYVDLDGFKRVNDTLGHAAGDDVLVGVAQCLRESARPGDLLARLGGDEFALVLPDLQVDRVGAEPVLARVADRVRQAVAALGLHGLPVRASVGTALHPDDGDTAEELVRRADRAMYLDKQGPVRRRRSRP